MRRILVVFLASLGVLFLLLIVLFGALGWWAYRELAVAAPPPLPERIILDVDLRGTLEEEIEPSPLRLLEHAPRPDLTGTLEALAAAREDPRVVGLLARIDATSHGLATAQELRQAIARFRAAGKFAVAHAQSFGELGAGNEGYYLASAFEEIALQPSGIVGITGLLIEVPYLRGLLDRLGIAAEVEKRAEYKTVFESFTEYGPTPANREMLESLLDDLYAQLAAGIAEGRRLAPGEASRIIGGGPYTAREALELGLIDRIAHLDEYRDSLRTRTGGEAEFVSLLDYLQRAGEREQGVRIAYVRASGLIRPGSGNFERGIFADDLADALRDAAEDEKVRAVLLRIDSGGGSATASETIARALAQLRTAGKPVVVSMGNAAASGAYWLVAAADRLLAEPATLTGSIGVVAARPVLAGLWSKLDVNWFALARGRHAGMYAISRGYSAEERARVAALLDDLYGRFLEVVAEGRGLPADKVARIARGRVWTGRQALELGLVDGLGGLEEAKAALRELLDLPADARLELVPFPPPRGPVSWIASRLRRWTAARPGPDFAWLEGPLLLAPPLLLR